MGEQLEDQSSAEDDAAVTAVRRPLVEERPGVHRSCRDTEVAGVRGVEHVSPELRTHVLTDARVLDDPEIQVADSVSSQDVSAGATEPFTNGSRTGERTIALQCTEERLTLLFKQVEEFLGIRGGQRRSQVCANGVTDEAIDTV